MQGKRGGRAKKKKNVVTKSVLCAAQTVVLRDQRTVSFSNERFFFFLLKVKHTTSVFKRTKAARRTVLKAIYLLTAARTRW